MTDAEFDGLVAGFFRAACGAIGWGEAIEALQRALPAAAVHLFGVDLPQDCIAFSHFAAERSWSAILAAFRTGRRVDPLTRRLLRLQPGQWLAAGAHPGDEVVAVTPFPQGLVPSGGQRLCSKLLQDATRANFLCVYPNTGSPPATTAALLGRLALQLAEALSAGGHTEGTCKQGRLGIELLARLRLPVLLIDEQRRVLQANPAARTLLQDSRAFVESAGRLHCHHAADDRAFVDTLSRLLQADGPQPGGGPQSAFLRARAPSGGAPLGLQLHALPRSETRQAFGEQALAMLLLLEFGQAIELDTLAIATAFELTPGEARVAVAVAQGQSPARIAQRHGVSTGTVRAHLHTIFSKTGTTRQAELVALFARSAWAALAPAQGQRPPALPRVIGLAAPLIQGGRESNDRGELLEPFLHSKRNSAR